MTYFKPLLIGFLGALVGSALWYAAAVLTGEPLPWLACLVGAAAGMGVRLATEESGRGIGPGLIAVAAAAMGIMMTRHEVMAVTIPVDPQTAKMLAGAYENSLNEESMIAVTADEIVLQRRAAGEPVVWPEGMTYVDAVWEEDYPPDLWVQARDRWENYSAEEQAERREDHEREVRRTLDVQSREIGERLWRQTKGESHPLNSSWNIVWTLAAALVAFRLAAGPVSEL